MRLAPTAVAGALALVLAACGDGSTDGGSTVEAPATGASSLAPTKKAAGGGAGTGVDPDSEQDDGQPSTDGQPGATADPAPDSTFAARSVSGTPDVSQAADIATDLDVPWDLAFLPEGTALVTLRDQARVVRVDADGSVASVTADGQDGQVAGVAPDGEGGLLGITTDATAEHVFVYLTGADDNRVVRYAWDPGADSLTEPTDILTGIPKSGTHNGGRIDLGPDGLLYVATGDAQDRSSPPDPSSLAGKILRVTTVGEPAPGNPDPGSPVWTSGHRNVQGLGWSADGTMWASEFGQDRIDELNVIQPGADYGWPEVEGVGDVAGLTDPVVTWGTAEASPSGIAVADDAVYVAGLRGQRLWRVPITAGGRVGGEPEAYLQDELGRLRHVEVAPDGSLWVLTSNTFRGDPRADDDRIVRVPLG